MTAIQRFALHGTIMNPHSSGPYVRYEDHLAAMQGRCLAQIEEPAGAAPAAVAGPTARKVFLVATGETSDGAETYTRHDDAPPPMCDAECLYTAPAAPALEAPAAPAVPLKATPEMRAAFRSAFREGGFWDDRLDYALDQMLAAAPQAPAAPTWDQLRALAVKHGAWVSGYGPFATELLATYGRAPEDQPHWVAKWMNAVRAEAAPAAPAVDALDADRWRALESKMDEGRVSLTVHHTEAEQWDGRTISDAGELQDYADSLAAQAKEGGA